MKKIYYFLATLLITGIITFCYMSFGNLQSNKYVFMFQCYTLPEIMGDEPVMLDVPASSKKKAHQRRLYPMHIIPKDYAGVWRVWSRNGVLTRKISVSKGIQVDCALSFYESTGSKKNEYLYSKANKETINKYYFEDGTLEKIVLIMDGKRSSTFIFLRSHNTDNRKQYKDKLEEFDKSVAKFKNKD